jgi:hypothetical protein
MKIEQFIWLLHFCIEYVLRDSTNYSIKFLPCKNSILYTDGTKTILCCSSSKAAANRWQNNMRDVILYVTHSSMPMFEIICGSSPAL